MMIDEFWDGRVDTTGKLGNKRPVKAATKPRISAAVGLRLLGGAGFGGKHP